MKGNNAIARHLSQICHGNKSGKLAMKDSVTKLHGGERNLFAETAPVGAILRYPMPIFRYEYMRPVCREVIVRDSGNESEVFLPRNA